MTIKSICVCIILIITCIWLLQERRLYDSFHSLIHHACLRLVADTMRKARLKRVKPDDYETYKTKASFLFPQSFIEPVPPALTQMHIFQGQSGGPSILLVGIESGLTCRDVIMQSALWRGWMYLLLVYDVFLERSPLVTGLAVAFLFVQNRSPRTVSRRWRVFLREFFTDSTNSERWKRWTIYAREIVKITQLLFVAMCSPFSLHSSHDTLFLFLSLILYDEIYVSYGRWNWEKCLLSL